MNKYGTHDNWQEMRRQAIQTWAQYLYTLSTLQQDLPKKVCTDDPAISRLRATLPHKREPAKKTVAAAAVLLATRKSLALIQQDVSRLEKLVVHTGHPVAAQRLTDLKRWLQLVTKQRNRLVQSNLGLTHKVAAQMCTKNDCGSLTRKDLVQHGTVGLILSVERFDPARGYKFSSFALWNIRASMQQAIADTGRLVRLTSNVEQDIRTLTGASRPGETDKTVRERLGLNKKQYDQLSRAKRQRGVKSLSAPAKGIEDGSVTQQDQLRAKVPNLDERIDQDRVRALLHNNLVDLSPRDQDILCRRFGLCGRAAHSLSQIGRHYGLSKEAVRQAERKALNKLHRSLTLKNKDVWQTMGYEVTLPRVGVKRRP